MANENVSAIGAIRALRDMLRNKLEQNEDYRAWKALDEVVRQLEPPTMPRVDFGLTPGGPAKPEEQGVNGRPSRGSLSGLIG